MRFDTEKEAENFTKKLAEHSSFCYFKIAVEDVFIIAFGALESTKRKYKKSKRKALSKSDD